MAIVPDWRISSSRCWPMPNRCFKRNWLYDEIKASRDRLGSINVAASSDATRDNAERHTGPKTSAVGSLLLELDRQTKVNSCSSRFRHSLVVSCQRRCLFGGEENSPRASAGRDRPFSIPDTSVKDTVYRRIIGLLPRRCPARFIRLHLRRSMHSHDCPDPGSERQRFSQCQDAGESVQRPHSEIEGLPRRDASTPERGEPVPQTEFPKCHSLPSVSRFRE